MKVLATGTRPRPRLHKVVIGSLHSTQVWPTPFDPTTLLLSLDFPHIKGLILILNANTNQASPNSVRVTGQTRRVPVLTASSFIKRVTGSCLNCLTSSNEAMGVSILSVKGRKSKEVNQTNASAPKNEVRLIN